MYNVGFWWDAAVCMSPLFITEHCNMFSLKTVPHAYHGVRASVCRQDSALSCFINKNSSSLALFNLHVKLNLQGYIMALTINIL
jgi:hypothetical protein